ncbi:MAG: signal peptidase II [Bdellovibrionota bacterium]
MSQLRRITLVSGILLAGFGIDQVTKQFAISSLRGKMPLAYFWNFFRFEYAENQGAFLSLGAGLSEGARFWLLTFGVAVFLVLFLFYIVIDQKLGFADLICYALVISGGASNLFDRAFRPQGRVIDFMNVGIGNLRTGIFNVADVYITTGILLLMGRYFYQEFYLRRNNEIK